MLGRPCCPLRFPAVVWGPQAARPAQQRRPLGPREHSCRTRLCMLAYLMCILRWQRPRMVRALPWAAKPGKKMHSIRPCIHPSNHPSIIPQLHAGCG